MKLNYVVWMSTVAQHLNLYHTNYESITYCSLIRVTVVASFNLQYHANKITPIIHLYVIKAVYVVHTSTISS